MSLNLGFNEGDKDGEKWGQGKTWWLKTVHEEAAFKSMIS